MNNGELPVAAQIKTVYLATSETAIYRYLSHFKRWRPLVLAEHLENLERFPAGDVRRISRAALWRRAACAALRAATHDATMRARFRWSAAVSEALSGARVLHAHFGESGLAALDLQRRSGLPLITSFHGRDAAQPYARPYGRLLYRPLFRAGTAFTVVSDFMRKQVVALGAPPERVTVVRAGIDPDEIAFAPRVWPASGAVRLMACGRLVEKKGIRYAIEALARVRRRYPAVTLSVVGDGPLRASLEQLAARRGVADAVEFLGAQPVTRVMSQMADSHLFVLPCVTARDGDQEGVPGVFMEAQASGLPVLSTWHAGVPEIVRDGQSGRLAPERDSDRLAALLEELLEHPERWPAMGAAGRERVLEEFDVRKATARIEDLYDQVARRTT